MKTERAKSKRGHARLHPSLPLSLLLTLALLFAAGPADPAGSTAAMDPAGSAVSEGSALSTASADAASPAPLAALRSGLHVPGLAAVPARAAEADGAAAGEAGPEEDHEDESGRLWSEDYYRAVDTTGGLSEAEVESLDAACLEFMQTYQADVSLLAVTPADHEGATLEEMAEGYYADCGFGYGEGRDGFQMVWDTGTGEVVLKAFGAARDMVPESFLVYITENVTKYEEEYGHFGPMYATARYLTNYLRGGGDAASAEADGTGTDAPAGAENMESGSPDAAGFENGAAARAQAAEQQDTEGASDPQAEPEGSGAAQAQDAGAGTGSGSGTGSGTEAGASSGSGTLSAEGAAEGDTAAAASEGLQTAKPDEAVTRDGALSESDRMLPDGEVPDASLRVGEGSGMPAWYPKDPASFPFYHDENAPRVVDVADIFSDSEEAQMEARLAELRRQLGRDIVVFTDVSTYGLSRSVYAADFYDFNGYGIGDEREGVCLMVCMDPDNRGWWTCCTGSVTRGLYTETVANQIDDLLYEYMRAGDYGPGVQDWIENFRRLYVTGSPYNEEWALADPAAFQRFHDEDAPRIVDDAGILSDEEEGKLQAQALAISMKHGVDVVIHTALHQGILDRQEYADLFYLTHGYGFGDAYDGIQLTLYKRPAYTGGERVTAYGAPLDKLTDVNRSRLEERCDSLVSEKEYYEAASQWLSQADHMLRTGRAPRSSASWGFSTIVELLAGLIFGGVSLGRARAGMATPKIRERADAYLVKGSLRVRNVADTFLRTTIDKRYSPPPKEDRDSDSGGSSGGHSSYSGSYSGSSGSSHSGSGRSF